MRNSMEYRLFELKRFVRIVSNIPSKSLQSVPF